jgi:hypothetical protein
MKKQSPTTRSLFQEIAAKGAENPWFTKPGLRGIGVLEIKAD